MSHDARMSAWLNAWDRIQALQKFKLEHAPNMESPLPEGYWGVVLEAQILATLATADTLVGVTLGELLAEREQQECESAERAADFQAKFEEAKKKAKEREDPSCTCSFDDSQCPIHSQGDDIVDDEEGLPDDPSR